MDRRSSLAAALLGLAALTGCGPRWRAVAQATPDPFVDQRYFAVAPIDYTGLRIDGQPEARHLADKSQEARRAFQGEKAAIDEQFAKTLITGARGQGIHVAPLALATGPASAPFLIRPYVNSLKSGYYAVVAEAPSQLDLTIRIMARDGRVLDEVALTHRTPPPNPTTLSGQANADKRSSGGRWREDARELGALVADYLASRVAP